VAVVDSEGPVGIVFVVRFGTNEFVVVVDVVVEGLLVLLVEAFLTLNINSN